MYKQQNLKSHFSRTDSGFDQVFQYIMQGLDKRNTRQLNIHFLWSLMVLKRKTKDTVTEGANLLEVQNMQL